MSTAAGILGEASALIADAVRRGLLDLDDHDLLGVVAQAEEVGRLVDTLRVLCAAEVEERSRYELGVGGLSRRFGETRGVHLIEKITRVSQREASRRVRLGRAIRPRVCLDGQILAAEFPLVSEAMSAGILGVDAAANVIQSLTQAARRHAPQERIDVAEEALVGAAATESADLIAIRARVWREALDPDGAEPRDEALRLRRALWIGREENGMTKFGGYADPVNAALLRAALAERSGPGVTPRFLSEDDAEAARADQEGRDLSLARDPRTNEQKQFDIVFGLITSGIRSSESAPGSMRSLTSVVAVVKMEDLRSGKGVGWLDDVAEPISVASVEELICDGGSRMLVVGDYGEVLNLGPLERFFSRLQRLALAVRDGGCIWLGCTAPPAWCHAHHVLEYANGGTTDVDNGVLLCPEHHHALHNSDYSLTMINGKPYLLAPVWLDPTQTWVPLGKSRVDMVPAGVAA